VVEEIPQQETAIKRPEYPFSSPLYAITQMIAVVLNLQLVLPAVLNISWTGTMTQLGLFLLVFATAFIVVTIGFLALAGYFAILLVVAQNLRKLSISDARNQDVAKAIAIRVLLGNQPRWLISLTPCVVPAVTFGIVIQFFFKDKLAFNDGLDLLESCLLQGLISFMLCLPYIIRTQRVFGTNVLENVSAESRRKD
jgi:hypothetical protein